MAVSPVRREQRAVLAAWLNDRFGHTLEPQPGKDRVLDGAFWKDAYDLIKFLESNGFYLDVPEDYRDNPFPEYDHGGVRP